MSPLAVYAGYHNGSGDIGRMVKGKMAVPPDRAIAIAKYLNDDPRILLIYSFMDAISDPMVVRDFFDILRRETPFSRNAEWSNLVAIDYVEEHMKKNRVKGTDLARKCKGMTVSTYYNYAKGVTNIPPHYSRCIAEAVKADPQFLLWIVLRDKYRDDWPEIRRFLLKSRKKVDDVLTEYCFKKGIAA